MTATLDRSTLPTGSRKARRAPGVPRLGEIVADETNDEGDAE